MIYGYSIRVSEVEDLKDFYSKIKVLVYLKLNILKRFNIYLYLKKKISNSRINIYIIRYLRKKFIKFNKTNFFKE